MLLYPQLPHPVTERLASELRRAPVMEAAERFAYSHPGATFTATGGARAGEGKLRDVRRGLLDRAGDGGYPSEPSEEQRLAFDLAVSAGLHDEMNIPPGEATKPGVWEFMTCVLAPDIVRWRFPGSSSEGTTLSRFFSGRRNVFQRLWWRGHLLSDPSQGDESYEILRELGEDEQVQIMERPSLAAIPVLRQAVTSEFLLATERYPGISPRRILLREAQKKLMRLAAVTSFGSLDAPTVKKAVRVIFDEVAASLGP